MRNTQYDAVVIGAGHNGLVTAGYLAKEGLKVLVLERLDKVGGACVTEEIFPGFFGPFCAYICYMLQGKVIDDLKLREHGLDIIPLAGGRKTWFRLHPFPDGTYLKVSGMGDPLEEASEIGKFSERDARAYWKWEEFWREASGLLYDYFLREPPTLAELVDKVRGSRKEQILEKMLTWSIMDLIDEHFEDKRVRAHMIGIPEMDPRAPGSIMSAAYFRASQFSRPQDKGIPRGSMGAITQALAKAVKSLGGEIRTNAWVQEIIVEDSVAKGVRLITGEEIRSFLVVSNADPMRTFTTLLRPEDLDDSTRKRVRATKTRAGCVKFLAALRELPDFSRYIGPDYERGSIYSIYINPSEEYFFQSWEDCQAGKPSSCPIMHIQIPSVVDPTLTPRGGHILSNWVLYEPPHLKNGSWDNAKKQIGEQIIDILTEYAPNFRSSLIDWTVQTPVDLERRVGLTDGNIRHGDMIPQQMLALRWAYRTPIRNLYLCGAGTHPGGEVTGAPGHNAAQEILKDLQKPAVRI